MKILKRLPLATIRDAIELAKCLWADFRDEELFARYNIEGEEYLYSANRQDSKLELTLTEGTVFCSALYGWAQDVPAHTQVVALLALNFLKQWPAPPSYSDIHLPQSILESCVEAQESDQILAMEKVVVTLETAATFWLYDKWHCPVCTDNGCEMEITDHYRRWSLPRHNLLLSCGVLTKYPVFVNANELPDPSRGLAEEWNQKYSVWLRGVGHWNNAFPEWALSNVNEEAIAEAISTGFSIETLRKLVSLTEEQISETVAFYNAGPSAVGELASLPAIRNEKYVSPFTNQEE